MKVPSKVFRVNGNYVVFSMKDGDMHVCCHVISSLGSSVTATCMLLTMFMLLLIKYVSIFIRLQITN